MPTTSTLNFSPKNSGFNYLILNPPIFCFFKSLRDMKKDYLLEDVVDNLWITKKILIKSSYSGEKPEGKTKLPEESAIC